MRKDYKIYEIRDHTTGKSYIGSTQRSLKKRLYFHKKDLEYDTYCSSHEIIKNNNFTIFLLENFRANDRKELYLREGLWIKIYKDYGIPLTNINSGCGNKKPDGQYYQEHKKDIIEKQKKRYYEKKEEIKQYNLERYKNNKEKIKKYNLEYYYKNKDKIREKMKNKYKKKIIKTNKHKKCVCGAQVLNINQHLKTKKHKDYLSLKI